MKELGIYIHIPFCKQKCYYCDFYSLPNNENLIEQYIKTLLEEINEFFKLNKGKYNITTIYIGGGTPSYIDSKYINDIIYKIKENVKINKNVEITIEINPGTVNEQKLKEYYKSGINRLSIGLQSTDNVLLKKIGRIHTYEEFVKNYKMARDIGFENINIDLMLALPEQQIKDLEESVDKIIKLNPEHISVYSLILEEDTKLYEMIKNKVYNLPNDKEERIMYWNTKQQLEQNGYIHYEISNFCKNGFTSKHNINCWEQKEYIGFGAGAHSYINLKRFSNICDIKKYINNRKENITIHEIQDKNMQMKEYMILALRKLDGINLKQFKEKFNTDATTIFEKEIDKLIKEELIKVDKTNIKLTNKGLDFANIVWQEFV